MKKKKLVGYMEKYWSLKHDTCIRRSRSIFLNHMGIARSSKDEWHPIKVRITIEEIK